MLAITTQDIDQFCAAFGDFVWSVPLFLLLLGCGLAFSVASKFAQWRILTHGYSCIRGQYDQPGDTGHINHFQALCAALSATIGLGNIAGVAVAVSLGGPGAIFWMWVVGFFGMALKFMECTLAVMYRDVSEPGAAEGSGGEVRGGPMWYIQKALVDPMRARGSVLWVLFKMLAVFFAIAAMLNSFGGGNMFQGWNVANQLKQNFQVPEVASGLVVSILVGLVIIGGIKRIGNVASKLVPFMCVIYVAGALYVVLVHADEIPRCLALIVHSAFTPVAGSGACIGVTVWIAFKQGMRRACFSNEAGEGSAAMAHAAAKTEEPVREGIVAGIGPFIDTIIICTLSALVLLMTGVWNRAAVGEVVSIDGDHVLVSCNADVPENLSPLYYDMAQPGDDRELAVYVERTVGREPTTVIAEISSVEADAGDSWSAMRTLTLDLGSLRDKDTAEFSEEVRGNIARLEPGQPVHVDITGAHMTAFAFDTTVRGFGKYIVTLGVCLFAFSTMISWSYYGEKGAEYLLGPRAILPYKFVFVVFVFLGMVIEKFATAVDFSDATTGLMVLCNLPAVLLLSPVVLRAAKKYFARLDNGDMPRRG
ncbi:MAG: sodium:alanine symporter family protein [bacterium]|nr:sodium:alanine symporter family protein [bacterium]